MKHAIALAAACAGLALSLASPPAPAQAGPGYGPGYGPGMGMMGPGYGMMGPGYGMMGPGGYGPGAYGPGMGMGMGPGMMGGWGGLPANLSAEQRTKIAEIQRDLRKRQWPLMQEMHELMWTDAEQGALDEQAQRRQFERHAALQKQMFEGMLDARKRIDAVLTPQQREELRRGPGPKPPAR